MRLLLLLLLLSRLLLLLLLSAITIGMLLQDLIVMRLHIGDVMTVTGDWRLERLLRGPLAERVMRQDVFPSVEVLGLHRAAASVCPGEAV